MYQYTDGQWSYDYVNMLSYYAIMVASLFLFNFKRNSQGLFSRYITHVISQTNRVFADIISFVLVSIETLLFAHLLDYASVVNEPFGNLFGTGKNYFGLLFVVPVIWFLLSILFLSNPLKQIDGVTVLLPIQLFFFKIACFCAGCCWGIEWKYGLYNHHQHHPGTQVPIQAIEAFLALAIFIFLLIYRKKAKTGTVYPMYMILYSATRFPVEFLSAANEKIVGPFNVYHFLCIIGIAVGVLMLLFVKYFGEKLTEVSEKPHKRLDAKIAKEEEEKAEKIAEEEAKRLEKVKAARAKAKARRGK